MVAVVAFRTTLDFLLCFSETDMGWGFYVRFAFFDLAFTYYRLKKRRHLWLPSTRRESRLRSGRTAFSSMLIRARNAVHGLCWPSPLRTGRCAEPAAAGPAGGTER